MAPAGSTDDGLRVGVVREGRRYADPVWRNLVTEELVLTCLKCNAAFNLLNIGGIHEGNIFVMDDGEAIEQKERLYKSKKLLKHIESDPS